LSSLISTAANSTFNEFDTSIPGLPQTADIIEAFKLYHYGRDNFGPGDIPATESIYGHLEKLREDIDGLIAQPDTINPLLLIGA
jgi:hypothetical protein